jgi:hypothetical protein
VNLPSRAWLDGERRPREGGGRVEKRDPLSIARARRPAGDAGGHDRAAIDVEGRQGFQRADRLARQDVGISPVQVSANLNGP